MPTQTKLRKNSKARSWTSKKIKQLMREGYEHGQAVAIALSEARRHGLVKNPQEVAELEDSLEQAQEVARGFHGRGNEGEVEEVEEEQFRSELALLGELVELEVVIDDEICPFEFSRDDLEDVVRLACSGDRKQLFLVGGDQELDEEFVDEFGQTDKVTIGYVYSISYFADKHHLTGPKQQKFGTEYIHAFGEQTFPASRAKENGVWKVDEKIDAGLLPELIYDRLNGRMELVGGRYEVKDEGIWD